MIDLKKVTILITTLIVGIIIGDKLHRIEKVPSQSTQTQNDEYVYALDTTSSPYYSVRKCRKSTLFDFYKYQLQTGYSSNMSDEDEARKSLSEVTDCEEKFYYIFVPKRDRESYPEVWEEFKEL